MEKNIYKMNIGDLLFIGRHHLRDDLSNRLYYEYNNQPNMYREDHELFEKLMDYIFAIDNKVYEMKRRLDEVAKTNTEVAEILKEFFEDTDEIIR